MTSRATKMEKEMAAAGNDMKKILEIAEKWKTKPMEIHQVNTMNVTITVISNSTESFEYYKDSQAHKMTVPGVDYAFSYTGLEGISEVTPAIVLMLGTPITGKNGTEWKTSPSLLWSAQSFIRVKLEGGVDLAKEMMQKIDFEVLRKVIGL